MRNKETNNKRRDRITKFNFLLDQPLEADVELSDVKFGHEEIAKALENTIIHCPTPFTIGLFGDWGSGKSTIANLLKRNLANKVPTVIFDVWKDDEHSLRRVFLKELDKQLRSYNDPEVFKNDFELEDRLTSGVSKSSKILYKPSWLVLDQIKKKFTWANIMKALKSPANPSHYIAGLILLFFVSVYLLGFLPSVIAIIGTIVIGGSFLVWMLELVGVETVAYGLDKFQDGHEFENEFARILIEGLQKKRLLIIFDNLDRVFHQKALEVLSTIKTFLEPKDREIPEREVVFLIPCDDKAIKLHIKSLYNSKLKKPDEFFRKFFNTTFRIPVFITTELEAYTANMLKKTNVQELNDEKVAWIITKAYRDNPRQIKQFINTLLASYLLIKERQGKDKDFPEDFLKNQLPQLARFLILSEIYPNEMQIIRDSKIFDLDNGDLISINSANPDSKNDFIDFINNTKANYPIQNLRYFFTLRRSEQEKKLPGIDEFLTNLEDKNTLSAEEYLKGIKDFNSKKDELSQVISARLSDITSEVSLAVSISTILEILDNSDKRLNVNFFGDIYNLLINKVEKYFYYIPPSILSRVIAEPYYRYQDGLVVKWMSILLNIKNEKPQPADEYLIDLIKLIITHDSWFDKHGNKIRDILADKFANKLWIGGLFKDNQTAQKKFLTNQFIKNFIAAISEEDIDKQELANKMQNLINFVEQIFDKEAYENLLRKMADLQSYENSRTTGPERNEIKVAILDSWQLVLEKFQTKFKEINDQTIWELLVTSLMDGCNQVGDWDSRDLFIPTMLAIEDFLTDPKITELRNYISEYFNSASTDSMDYVFGITKINLFDEKSAYYPIFKLRAIQDQNIFDYFYKKLANETKTDWLLTLLQHDHNRLLTKLETENYKIPDSGAITEKLLEKLDSVENSGQARIFNTINKLKFKKDKQDKKNIYVEKIKNRLTSSDHSIQQIGFNALNEATFLGKERNRKLTKEVFDWLKEPEITDKYQPFSIKAINRGYQYLNNEEANNFKQFLFDDIIRLSRNHSAIDFAFTELTEIRPTFQDRKQNFEDIRSRYESETNDDIKKVLASGLKNLLPSGQSTSKDFQKWLNSLPT